MPPYLHPRSNFTTSLFGATLLVSFLVVGMPHIIPCPAPRIVLADVDSKEGRHGQQRRRRRRQMETNGVGDEDDMDETSINLAEESERMKKRGHECPIPKPGGIVGEVLGLEKSNDRMRKLRPEVVVEREEDKRSRERREE